MVELYARRLDGAEYLLHPEETAPEFQAGELYTLEQLNALGFRELTRDHNERTYVRDNFRVRVINSIDTGPLWVVRSAGTVDGEFLAGLKADIRALGRQKA
jgi:hypothetical protein